MSSGDTTKLRGRKPIPTPPPLQSLRRSCDKCLPCPAQTWTARNGKQVNFIQGSILSPSRLLQTILMLVTVPKILISAPAQPAFPRTLLSMYLFFLLPQHIICPMCCSHRLNCLANELIINGTNGLMPYLCQLAVYLFFNRCFLETQLHHTEERLSPMGLYHVP